MMDQEETKLITKEFYKKAVALLDGYSQVDIKRKEQGQLDLFDFLQEVVSYVLCDM